MLDKDPNNRGETETLRIPLRNLAVNTIRRELAAHEEGVSLVELFETVRRAAEAEFGYDLYTWDDFDSHMLIISVSGKMTRLLRESAARR